MDSNLDFDKCGVLGTIFAKNIGWHQRVAGMKMKNLNMVSLAPEAVDLLSKDQDPQPVSHPCLMSSNSSYAGESWAGGASPRKR